MPGYGIMMLIKNKWTIRTFKTRKDVELLFEYRLGRPGGFALDLGLTKRIIGLAVKDDSMGSCVDKHFYHWTIILGFVTVGIRLWLKINRPKPI